MKSYCSFVRSTIYCMTDYDFWFIFLLKKFYSTKFIDDNGGGDDDDVGVGVYLV